MPRLREMFAPAGEGLVGKNRSMMGKPKKIRHGCIIEAWIIEETVFF